MKHNKTFRYQPLRDIIGVVSSIPVIIIIGGFLVNKIPYIIASILEFKENERLKFEYSNRNIIYVYITIFTVIYIYCFIEIWIDTYYKRLRIKENKIVYSYGLIKRSKKIIRYEEIISCLQKSTFLQRKCKTMDIVLYVKGKKRRKRKRIVLRDFKYAQEIYEDIMSKINY